MCIDRALRPLLGLESSGVSNSLGSPPADLLLLSSMGGPQTWQEAAHRAPRGWGIWSQHPQPAGTERPAPGPGPRRPLEEATRCSAKPPLRPWGCGSAEAQSWSPQGPQAYSGPTAGEGATPGRLGWSRFSRREACFVDGFLSVYMPRSSN